MMSSITNTDPPPGASGDTNEHGAALIMVLGAMALALAFGTAFVLMTMSERTASTTHVGIVEAEQLAQRGLDDAIAALQSRYDPNDGSGDTDDRYPATQPDVGFYAADSGDFAGRSYLFSTSSDDSGIAEALAVNMGSRVFVPQATLEVTSTGRDPDDARGFLPVIEGGRLVGRVAFMVIDESGKLDPNVVADPDDGGEASGSVTRVGASISEICLADCGLSNPDSYQPPTGSRWFSTRGIARRLAPADFASVGVRVLFPHSLDDSKYWNDNDNDGIYDDGELYDKLDLSSDTDTSVVRLYKAFVAPDDPDDAVGEVGDTNDDNDCFWLKQLAADGVAADGVARRQYAAQLAVNIKDYRDPDWIRTPAWVTADGRILLSDPGDGSAVSFVRGRERQYGLSELSTKVDVTVTGGDFIVDVSCQGEVYYPYATGDVGYRDDQLRITMTIDAAESHGSNLGDIHRVVDRATFVVPMTRSTDVAGGTLVYSDGWQVGVARTWPNFFRSRVAWTITNLQLDQVELLDGTTVVQSYPVDADHDYWWNWSTQQQQRSETLYCTLEAFDPMDTWMDEADYTPSSRVWRALPPGNMQPYSNDQHVDIGELTHQGSHGTGHNDFGDYNQPAVKNAAFERVGEIGRVSSYLPRRTVRLWAASGSDEDGVDTALLDMFRIGPPELRRGPLNANTTGRDVLTGLFKGTTTVSESTAVDAVLDRRADTTFTRVGDFFAIADLTGTNAEEDRAEEEMVVKLCELLQVNQNYFTIVVCAQSIRDVGGQTVYQDLNGDGDTYDAGEAVATSYGTYDAGADRILATRRLLAVVRRNAITNKATVEYVEQLSD